ncbi:MAG: FAD-dependent oxidoreductase, partial [Clostridia bacterium]|nr:FAD-dependent oxidoreductase [Clostridia bacterium]
MLQKLNNLRLPIGFDSKALESAVKKKLNGYKVVKIDKLSIDSRKKNDIHYVASVVVDGRENPNLNIYIPPKTSVSELVQSKVKLNSRPFIIGSGPCGM